MAYLLRDIRLQNLSDLGFDLSTSRKVECDGAIGLSTYGFLFIYTNCMSNSHRLAVLVTQDVFSYLLSLDPNYAKSKVHQMTSQEAHVPLTLCLRTNLAMGQKFQKLHIRSLSNPGRGNWAYFRSTGKVSEIMADFKIAIFGDETWPLAKIPEVAHILSF